VIDITIPAMGVAMTEAVVLKWLKQPGDPVEAEEPVLEIETDKANAEVPSPAAGRLSAHLVAEEDVIPVGTVVARVLVGDEADPGADGDGRDQSSDAAEPDFDGESDLPAGADAATLPQGGGETRRPRESPRARASRLAAERAGADGPRPDGPVGGGPDRFRDLIAAKTQEAWRTAPHFGVKRSIDAEPLLARLSDERARQSAGESRLTVTDLLLEALAGALEAVGDEGDIALAVATSRGVVNPVLQGIGSMGLSELAAAREGAVRRAREGELTEADLAAATSTLSNLGTSGVDWFTGIIPPGQRTLVTVGAIAPRPWVGEDGRVEARRVCEAIVTADHRILDGADSAELLNSLVDGVQGPKTTGPAGQVL
jgi:pyruvate/2-oxoglutarate dehydrogenase complex dihydrolipoamide acyltransferase (E2) component